VNPTPVVTPSSNPTARPDSAVTSRVADDGFERGERREIGPASFAVARSSRFSTRVGRSEPVHYGAIRPTGLPLSPTPVGRVLRGCAYGYRTAGRGRRLRQFRP